MHKKIHAEVLDDRRCILGESPTSYGPRNEKIMWVDILSKNLLCLDISNNSIGNYLTNEHVAFAIPRTQGGELLGTNSGPILRDPDGKLSKLPIENNFNLERDFPNSRWNDAKVSPFGDLWLGSMTYDIIPGKSALFTYSMNSRKIEIALPKVTISNGMAWSMSSNKFFYIDSYRGTVDSFRVSPDGNEIFNRKNFWRVDPSSGISPDGMTIDTEGGLWVALWNGSRVIRLDERARITLEIELPVSKVTSCCFADSNLDKLVITSASLDDNLNSKQSGMTFICETGFTGIKTKLFPF